MKNSRKASHAFGADAFFGHVQLYIVDEPESAALYGKDVKRSKRL